jgi:hypothetical protein
VCVCVCVLCSQVHGVELLKLLAADETFGFDISGILDANENWRKYKTQNHDLFLTADQKVDYFLTDGNTDAPQLLTWSGTVNKTSEGAYTKRLMGPSAAAAASSASAGAAAAAPASSSATGGAAAAGEDGGATGVPAAPPAPPASDAAAAAADGAAAPAAPAAPVPAPAPAPAAPAAAAPPPSPPTNGTFESTITKCNGKLCMDLGDIEGNVVIRRVKREEVPAGVTPPPDAASPPLLVGDTLTAVNGEVCTSFKDFVLKIRGSAATLKLTVKRA